MLALGLAVGALAGGLAGFAAAAAYYRSTVERLTEILVAEREASVKG